MIKQFSTFIFLVLLIHLLLISCNTEKKIIIQLAKTSNEIYIGDTVRLKWKVINADTLMFFPNGIQLDLEGELVQVPDTNIRYLFKAYHEKSRASKGFNVQVLKPEITVNTPIEVNDEDSFLVTWGSKYADYVTISISDKKYPAFGSTKLKIDSSQQIEFRAYNKNGYYKNCLKFIKVRYIEDFKYTAEVKRGERAFIQWKYKSVSKVYVRELERYYKSIDTARFTPQESKTYNLLLFKNNGDTIKKQIFINVRIPGIISFTTSNYIFKGQETFVSWSTLDPDSINIPGYAYTLEPKGRIKVKPDTTTIFNLHFFKNGEIQKAQCKVVVIKNRKIVTQSISYSELKKKSRFDFDIYSTDFSHYPDSVKLYVLVVDTFGNFVCDLAPPFGTKETSARFFKELVESNAKVKNHSVKNFRVVEVHEKNDIPIDINFTLDYSGSMWGNFGYLGAAFKHFIENKPSQSRISVVRFDDSVALEQALSIDKTEILNSIKNMAEAGDFGGGTALYAATDEGLESLESSMNNKMQVLFTDGYENSSFSYFGKRAIFAQEVAKKAKKQNTKINVIAFGEAVNITLLKFLTVITEGSFYNLFIPGDINKVMKELLYLNRNYYVITYKPNLTDGDNRISLIYDNNTGKTSKAEREVFVGNNFDLSEYEDTPAGSYWKNQPSSGNSSGNKKNSMVSNTSSAKSWSKSKKLSLPQAVAYFDFNKTDLKPDFFKKLDPYFEYLMKNSNTSLVIFGHTDLVGSEQSCDELSKNRAIKVKKYLTDKGIDEKRILIEACGKNFPIWKDETQPWKALENRRVEIMLIEN